jgi:hypothetical protein
MVIELLAVRVLPSAIVSVALEVGAVIATLLILLAVATPIEGVVKDGDVDRTTLPVPVFVETPVPPFVTGKTSVVAFII